MRLTAAATRAPLVYSRITVPTLVLVGDKDPALVGAREFYEMLPIHDRSWVEIPGASHLLFQIQRTAAVAEAIHA